MENPEAVEVWNSLFPGATVQVHWNAFLAIFENYFRTHFPINCQPHVTFQRALSHSIVLSGNYVTKDNFIIFLNLFGPLRLSLMKVCSNLFDSQGIVHPWYHYALTRDQSKSVLNALTEGHFLVRLSESQPGKFTLVYVSSDNQPKNILIYNHQESGYGLDPIRENCGEGRIFDNLAAFIALHPAKFRYVVKSAVFVACSAEGPALNTPTTTIQPKPSLSSTTMAGSLTNPKLIPAPISTAAPDPFQECPYGSFFGNGNGSGGGGINQNVHLNHQTQHPPSGLQTFNEGEDPYGYFETESLNSTITTPRNNGNQQSSTIPSQITPTNIYPPSHSNNPHQSHQNFTFSASAGNSLDESDYGYFPDPVSQPIDRQRFQSHDQILSIASCDTIHLEAPSCSRSISESAAKNRSFHDISSLPPSHLRLLHSQSQRTTSSSTNTSSPINRSKLSSELDESSHQAWNEGNYHQAMEMTNRVHEEIRNYLENLRKLHSIAERREERSASECDPLILSELTGWIPSTAAADDLRLLAKTLSQKGDIQKGMHADAEVCRLTYQESHDILHHLFNRMEKSDRGRFDEWQLFGRVHRKLALIYLCQENFPLAEHHFSEELAMMLLHENFTARRNAQQLINEYKRNYPQFAVTATESDSQLLLNQGIAAFNKGPSQFGSASELLAKAVQKSRLCGSETTELRALGNLATVESSRGYQFSAIRYYTQCVILCRKLHDNTTLKKILFKLVTCLMNVSLYNKALAYIDQLMAIATSLQNIGKLEELQKRAREGLAGANL